jgi:hypothetical protein
MYLAYVDWRKTEKLIRALYFPVESFVKVLLRLVKAN